jgi:invasion protein IalB
MEPGFNRPAIRFKLLSSPGINLRHRPKSGDHTHDTICLGIVGGLMTIHFRLAPAFPALLSAAFALSAVPAVAQATPQTGSAAPQLLGQYDDWGAYAANPNGRKVCFALSKPVKAETDPPNRPRDEPYLFISSRPEEKVKDEISVIFGYAFKPNAEASVEVGGSTFSLYTQSDGGWIKNAAEEPRLVDSLRRGSDATVKGVSARGATTTDTYSLKGVSKALERVAQECR